MLSTLLKAGPISIHSYGLMIALGFLAAVWFSKRDAAKAGIDPEFIGTHAIGALLLGILGTRILHILMFPHEYSWTDPIGWIAIWRGGLVFQGALPAALIYAVYACRRHQVPFWKMIDTALPYMALAHAFGRVGCFLNGCCYGCRTNLPWGICFPRVPWDFSQPATGSPAYLDHLERYSGLSAARDHWSYPVEPTQLFGVVGLLALCVILVYLRNRWHLFDGFVMPLYLILYSIGRFFVEFIRGDHNPTVFGFLSEQQLFCFISIAIGIALYVVLKKLRPAPAPPKPRG